MLVSPLPSVSVRTTGAYLSENAQLKSMMRRIFMMSRGKRATVVSKRRSYYYSPLVHMVRPELPQLGPVLRTPASGLLFLQWPVGFRFGVFRYCLHDQASRYFLPYVFLFFPAIAGIG